jgi:hypothetical protein
MKNILLYAAISLMLAGCSKSYKGELIFVEPKADDTFNFPYFLYIPDPVSQNEKVYVIIEPNNSGFADDDFQKHIEKAERTATKDFYAGNYAAESLQYPLLVPVFPRSKTEWKIYTHSLDRDVMLQKGSPIERPDKQLIGMFEDAQLRLKAKNIQTFEQFLLTGFSASGTFVNRFTLMHPEKVAAVAGGGVNGLLMLPTDSLNNEITEYPIGVGDFKELINKPFDKELFIKTPQFYFMGRLDDNDAIPYDDAFDQNEREQIYRLPGKQMQPERWNNCIKHYKNSHVNANIITYKEIGHEQPESVKKEIVNFFREAIHKN